MAEVLVSLFEDSDSFAEAKERAGFLWELKVWDASFIPRIKAAVESNSQINGSWGVSDRITALVKKWSGG